MHRFPHLGHGRLSHLAGAFAASEQHLHSFLGMGRIVRPFLVQGL
jgi:hypothetical protein